MNFEMSAAFGVGASFTLSTKMTGCGILPASSLSPSCLSTASKMLMPSAPARASRAGGVHLIVKSHLPSRPVLFNALPLPFAILATMRAKSSIDMLWQSTTCCGTVSGEGSLRLPLAIRGAAASAAGFILGLPLPAESTNPGSSFESLWILRLNRSASSV